MSTQEVHALLTGRTEIQRYAQRMDSAAPQKVRSFWKEILELPPGSRVLSIGAGSGLVEKHIAQASQSTVFCLDLNENLLEKIRQEATSLKQAQEPGEQAELVPVLADAERLPFPEKSFDLIVCSSVIHELASYLHEFAFNELGPVFGNLLKRLKIGGKFVIRDFMQPENPQQQCLIRVGEAQGQEMSPLEFLERFAHDFSGDSTESLLFQIQTHKKNGTWAAGAVLNVSKSLALEAILHYSWHSSYEAEVKEKYAYLPIEHYAKFVEQAGAQANIPVQISRSTAEAQSGYDTYTQGRLDLVDDNQDRVSLPAVTGTLVIERLPDSSLVDGQL